MNRDGDISVVITSHNEGLMINEALDSIERQTALHRIREVIIVDDGSDAETVDVLKHQAAIRPLVRLILQSNQGLPSARNSGIAAASGDYFAFLDADDWWDDRKFEKQMMLFSISPKVGLTYTDFLLVDPANFSNRARVKCRPFHWDDGKAQRNYFVHDGPMIPSSIVLKRNVVERVGPFDPSLPWGEDNEMCIRTLGSFAAEHLPEPLLLKRHRPGSLGSNYDRIVPYYERVTKKCVHAFPDLAAYAGRRMSRRYTRAGQSSLAKDDKAAARQWFVEAIRSYPGYYRPWVFLALSLLPVNAVEGVMTVARRIRHA
jgi:glycosyltransferase involved in cell wall biosynthesis